MGVSIKEILLKQLQLLQEESERVMEQKVGSNQVETLCRLSEAMAALVTLDFWLTSQPSNLLTF